MRRRTFAIGIVLGTLILSTAVPAHAAGPRQALDLFGRYLGVISGWAPTVDPDGIETQFHGHFGRARPSPRADGMEVRLRGSG
jgi:hypothetical protein